MSDFIARDGTPCHNRASMDAHNARLDAAADLPDGRPNPPPDTLADARVRLDAANDPQWTVRDRIDHLLHALWIVSYDAARAALSSR